MNKVIIINLGGTAWQLEEGGYDALRAYLDSAAARLQGNPDREEILSDIECAIAEKFRPHLGNHKNVVLAAEVAAALAAMGPIETGAGAAPEAESGGPRISSGSGGFGAAGASSGASGPGASLPPRRLYRLRDGEMIVGVCNGLAAYAHVDPTLVRLAFVFLTFLWGIGLLVYVVMAVVVPEARSPEEKSAASGNPSTAQEFIRRAREGYYEALRGFPDRQKRGEWKRRFQQAMCMASPKYRWRFHWRPFYWQRPWAGPVPAYPGLGFALPLMSLLQGGLMILWLCATVSLLATGAVLGLGLPDKMPVWLAALFLLFLYGLIAGPLKMARRACYWGYGESKPTWPLAVLADAVVAVAVVAVLTWLAFLYFPQLSEAVHNLPGLAHQAADDINAWFKAK